MPCGRRGWGWAGAVALVALTAAGGRARAQMCEDDGGLMCGADGGEENPDEDAGAPPASGSGGTSGAGSGGRGGSGSGMDAGGATDADACSCRATIDDEKQGRIDVCTQGNTRSACAGFECERGIVRDQLCSQSDIRLCCVMSDRDLISVLYHDCTHPNCVAGFTQQCADFDGQLRDRDCAQLLAPDNDDDSDEGDGCSVAGRAGRGGDAIWIAFGALGLLLGRRRLAG